MWRSLSQKAKNEYIELAFNLPRADQPTRRRKPKQPQQQPEPQPQPDIDYSPHIIEVPSTRTEEARPHEECPYFSIIPRGPSGIEAANASTQIVFSGLPSF
jgi:hypothetical protein